MPEGQQFGSYLLLKKIAAGGMAELYKARKSGEQGFRKLLAIKTILPQLTSEEDFITMFIDEARVAALLDHQNIVQIYDLGKIEDSYCIVMEYVHGKDLKKVLARAAKEGLMPGVELSCHIAASVLAGLSYAHRKKDKGVGLGIVHRDISPPNVLISYEGEVKIVDFGIAKAAIQSAETRVGLLKGKISYMSPEQAKGLPLDQRSDIFSAGIVFYEALTGRKLFKGDTDINTLEKVRAAKVEPLPSEINRDIPGELEAIALKALAARPEDRFQSASEMEDALLAFMRKSGSASGSHAMSRYMYRLFRDDMEDELREEGEWDETQVTPAHKAPPPAVTGPEGRVLKPAERDIITRGMSMPAKLAIAAAVVIAVIAMAFYRPFLQPEAKYQVKVQPPIPAPPAPDALRPKQPSAPAAISPAPADVQQPRPEPLEKSAVAEGEKTATKRLRAPAPPPAPPAAAPATAAVPAPAPETPPPAPRYGKLNIDSRPWFFVFIDGTEKGMTPLAGISLTEGPHVMTLVNPKLKIKRDLTVRVEPEKTTSVLIDPAREPSVREVVR